MGGPLEESRYRIGRTNVAAICGGSDGKGKRVGKKGEVDGRLLQNLESCVGAGHLFGQDGVQATENGRPDVAPLAH